MLWYKIRQFGTCHYWHNITPSVIIFLYQDDLLYFFLCMVNIGFYYFAEWARTHFCISPSGCEWMQNGHHSSASPGCPALSLPLLALAEWPHQQLPVLPLQAVNHIILIDIFISTLNNYISVSFYFLQVAVALSETAVKVCVLRLCSLEAGSPWAACTDNLKDLHQNWPNPPFPPRSNTHPGYSASWAHLYRKWPHSKHQVI